MCALKSRFSGSSVPASKCSGLIRWTALNRGTAFRMETDRLRRDFSARSGGETYVRCWNDAALQQRPARISSRVTAQGRKCRRDLPRRNDTVKRLGVNGVNVADGEMVELVGAVELSRPRDGATPARHGSCDDRSAALVDCDNVGTENAGHPRRRQRQRERIGRQDTSGNDADVYSVGRIGIENAQPGAIVVAKRRVRLLHA